MSIPPEQTAADQHSLDQIRQGASARAEGITRLYRAYARRFLAYLLKHRVPRAQAEELVQDAFVNIVRHCESFRGETRIDAWMWQILRNGLIDHIRRQRPEESVDEDELAFLAGGVEDAPVIDADNRDDCVRRAYAAFAETHHDRAQVLSLVTFDNWAIEDVATLLKRTPGATREYLSQCRKKLKVFLEPCREYLAS